MVETPEGSTSYRVEIRFGLDESGSPTFHYQPEHLLVSPGDRVEWTFAQGPWSVRPSPISPFGAQEGREEGGGSLYFQGAAGETDGGVIRDDVPFGKYENVAAVMVGGRVWIDDPHIIIRPPKRI